MIKINRKYRIPREAWEQGGNSKAGAMQVVGAEMMVVAGRIGWSGTKIHKLVIHYVDTDEGIGICDLMSTCGSQKWNSGLQVFLDTDLAKVDCQRCNGNCGNR